MREEIKTWNMALEDVNKRIVHKEYGFMNNLDFINLLFNDINTGMQMQIYWRELLQSLHLASVTALMRNQKWMQGVYYGTDYNNYIVFAASLRGYLEAFVDSYYSTNFKFISIAENFSDISKALEGTLDRPFYSKEFEESLIHYYSASKTANTKSYNAEFLDPLTARKYIDAFDLPNSELKHQLYSELCEIVHPASSSVKCFTKEDNSGLYTIRTVNGKDSKLIDEMLERYSKLLKLVFKVSNAIPVVNLKTLNCFKESCISSSYIENSLISNISVIPGAWETIAKKLVRT